MVGDGQGQIGESVKAGGWKVGWLEDQRRSGRPDLPDVEEVRGDDVKEEEQVEEAVCALGHRLVERGRPLVELDERPPTQSAGGER